MLLGKVTVFYTEDLTSSFHCILYIQEENNLRMFQGHQCFFKLRCYSAQKGKVNDMFDVSFQPSRNGLEVWNIYFN